MAQAAEGNPPLAAFTELMAGAAKAEHSAQLCAVMQAVQDGVTEAIW